MLSPYSLTTDQTRTYRKPMQVVQDSLQEPTHDFKPEYNHQGPCKTHCIIRNYASDHILILSQGASPTFLEIFSLMGFIKFSSSSRNYSHVCRLLTTSNKCLQAPCNLHKFDRFICIEIFTNKFLPSVPILQTLQLKPTRQKYI